MSSIDTIEVELSILVGQTDLSLQKLLCKGRGSVIPLGGDGGKALEIQANGRKIAEGKVTLRGEDVCVEVL